RSPKYIDLVVLVSGVLVALLLWWCLLWKGGTAARQWDVYAVLLLGAAACVVLRFTKVISVARFCATGIASLGAATVLTPMVTDLMLTYPQRGALSAAIPWAWAAVAMLFGIAIAGIGGRAGDSTGRRALSVLLIAFVLPVTLKVVPSFVPRKETASGNNIIVITADALRADMCSVYGGKVPTPALERMAGGGVLFRRAYAAAPWTVPSLCALFSSKYPPGLTPGADDEQRQREELSYHKLAPYFLDEDGKTFVERLQYEEHYKTGAFIGNLAIIYQHWLLNGFEEVRFLDTLSYAVRGRFELLPVLQTALAKVHPPLVRNRTMDSTDTLVQYAKDYIARHHNKNFFLWIHFMDPHTPFDPPKRYRSNVPEAPEAWQEFPPHPVEPHVEFAENMSETEMRIARELYKGEVRYIDWAVGKILRAVRRKGLNDGTYVCVSSDHGEELYDRGRYGHGYSMYDEITRVPLIVTGPDINKRTVDVPVSGIDLIPTFADLLEVSPRPEWRGRSLVPLLDGRNVEIQPIFAQSTHHFRYRPEPLQMILAWPWKLIRGLETGHKKLYNLAENPDETRDAAESHPKETENLNSMLMEWSETFPISFEQYTATRNETLGEVPPDLKEIFENQGYLGKAPEPPEPPTE
ncbi:MAG: sulfatase, partial [Candidatus Hydrogenedentota bacterium]